MFLVGFHSLPPVLSFLCASHFEMYFIDSIDFKQPAVGSPRWDQMARACVSRRFEVHHVSPGICFVINVRIKPLVGIIWARLMV